MNTAILIASSVTVVLAWAALKMRQFARYKFYMGITILCGVIFLVVKLAYEWPESSITSALSFARIGWKNTSRISATITCSRKAWSRGSRSPVTSTITRRCTIRTSRNTKSARSGERRSDESDERSPHFWPLPKSDKIAHVAKEDVELASMFIPKHSTFFATYFTITGLHGLHVLGGVIVFTYLWLPMGANLYKRNPEHLANRVEVAGLFWHFVDLVWIFVFPLFYLL